MKKVVKKMVGFWILIVLLISLFSMFVVAQDTLSVSNIKSQLIDESIKNSPEFVDALTLFVIDPSYANVDLETRTQVAKTTYNLHYGADRFGNERLTNLFIYLSLNEPDDKLKSIFIPAMGEIKSNHLFIHLAQEVRKSNFETKDRSFKDAVNSALLKYGGTSSNIVSSYSQKELCLNSDPTLFGIDEPVIEVGFASLKFSSFIFNKQFKIYTYRGNDWEESISGILKGDVRVDVPLYQDTDISKGFIIEADGDYYGYGGVKYESSITAVEPLPFLGPSICPLGAGSLYLEVEEIPFKGENVQIMYKSSAESKSLNPQSMDNGYLSLSLLGDCPKCLNDGGNFEIHSRGSNSVLIILDDPPTNIISDIEDVFRGISKSILSLFD